MQVVVLLEDSPPHNVCHPCTVHQAACLPCLIAACLSACLTSHLVYKVAQGTINTFPAQPVIAVRECGSDVLWARFGRQEGGGAFLSTNVMAGASEKLAYNQRQAELHPERQRRRGQGTTRDGGK